MNRVIMLALAVSALAAVAQAQPADRVALMQAEDRRCQNVLMPYAAGFQAAGLSLQSVCSCESQMIAGAVPQDKIAMTLGWVYAGRVPAAYGEASAAAVKACVAVAPLR